MKFPHFFLIAMLSGILTGYGQSQPQVTAGFDIGSGFNKNSIAPSILYHEELGLNRLSWLRLALGIRGWGYHAGATNLYAQNKSADRDTLLYRNVSADGVSFAIGIDVKIWKIDLGVNTDLAGLSYGSKRSGYYSKNTAIPGEGAAYYNDWVATSPNIVNVFPLAFSGNSGQSEIYARIWLTRKWGLKIGYSYHRVAYVTKNNEDKRVYLDHGQRRFSNTYGMPYAAIALPLF